MSESTPSGTEQNPFTRPGFIISAALVLALIAAVAVIFFLPKDDSTAQPAPAAPADTSAPAAPATSAGAAGKSICGLPSTPETALGAAPTSTWELVGKMAAPTDPTTIGPGITDEDGFRSCFAHTPTGALYAAANLVALGGLSDEGIQKKLIEELVVPGPGRDAALKDIRTPSADGSSSIQLRGFIIKTYSPSAANVDLAFETPDGALGHGVLPLRWTEGDWKVEISDSGVLINDIAQVRDLSGFIPWSGV